MHMTAHLGDAAREFFSLEDELDHDISSQIISRERARVLANISPNVLIAGSNNPVTGN